MRYLLLLMLACGPLYSQAQASATVAPGPPKPGLNTGTVCLPASQALLIDKALKRFEKLKSAYAEKAKASQNWRITHEQDSLGLATQTGISELYRKNYWDEIALRQDANKKLIISKGKAKRRGLLVAIETVAIALAGYVILTK